MIVTFEGESRDAILAQISDFFGTTGGSSDVAAEAGDKKVRKSKAAPAPEVEKEPEPKALTLEDVQNLLIKRAEGITDQDDKMKNRNTIKGILSEFGVGTVVDLPASDYEEFVDRIKSLK